jgi:hypothetical protein
MFRIKPELLWKGPWRLLLSEEGQYGEAEKFAREALEVSRKVNGPESGETVLSMFNLCPQFLGTKESTRNRRS